MLLIFKPPRKAAVHLPVVSTARENAVKYPILIIIGWQNSLITFFRNNHIKS